MVVKRYLLGFFIVVLTGCSSQPILDMLGAPVTINELSGDWVGYSGSGMHFYRLILRSNGDGVLVSLYNSDIAHAYRIREWQTKRNEIALSFMEEDVAKDPITVTGGSRGIHLLLHIKGDGWEHSCLLIREEVLERELTISKETIQGGLGKK
jgi:hypothetical protein